MTKEETYKKALQKISQYGIKPTGETEWQRIKRLKSIADKALFIADVIVPKGTLFCDCLTPELLGRYTELKDVCKCGKTVAK